ncbi:MAG: hypothetical protein SNJ66_03880 [Chloroherpetonaceae bacterium]
MNYSFSITRLPFALLLLLIAHRCNEQPLTPMSKPSINQNPFLTFLIKHL